MLAFCMMTMTSCTSLTSNLGNKFRDQAGMAPQQFGHVYSGVTCYIGSWGHFSSPRMKETKARYIGAPIGFVGMVIDLPLTLVMDTVLLPIEIFVESPYPRMTIDDEFKYSSQEKNWNREVVPVRRQGQLKNP